MSIPNNITKEHLLTAISKIDKEGIPKDGDSQYYDVVYNGKNYPPKIIVSYANIFANGELLDRSSFNGGIGTEAFKLLEREGFEIVTKTNSITSNIREFSNNYKNEVEFKYSGELATYKLLVNVLPSQIADLIKDVRPSATVKGSIGKGNNTYYPWIGIFDPKVSTGATNGFYVVLLFSDDFEDIYMTLNQGSTQQSKEQINNYRSFVYSNYDFIEGFSKGKIPENGLVKTKHGSAAEKGRKYQETNIFYKKYEVAQIKEEDFVYNFLKIVRIYFDCADKFSLYKHPKTEPHPDNNLKKGNQIIKEPNVDFNRKSFYDAASEAGYFINEKLSSRFISSLLTKPFVILTGLSGSGKTKLAQAFAMWVCENENQYCIVPVGADWTNREPLLGFPNALKQNEYVKPDNKVLDLIIEAKEDLEKPYFLILDEMNLSHVERYFADFLSVMESKGKISLHPGKEDWDGIPSNIEFPKNLFIIGTVNIDETTYMFSPKVLDRANVIEFRVAKEEMENYLHSHSTINLKSLIGAGAPMAANFIEIAIDNSLVVKEPVEVNEALMLFFCELKKTGAEFGYRSAAEILRFAAVVNKIEPTWTMINIIDAAIMQKLLPKVHGSRRKLEPILKTLGLLCLQNGQKFDDFLSPKIEIDLADAARIKYPLSFEKILRMYDNLISNGFTSYAEA